MKNKKLQLGILLFIFGVAGILSLLTMDIPLPEESKEILLAQFTPQQIKWLSLVNPVFLLILSLVSGLLLYEKAGLRLPVFEKITGKETSVSFPFLLKYGIAGGILAGLLITLVSFVFHPLLPEEFLQLEQNVQPTLAARFLYGGLTEEIMLRFGLMTFLVWLGSKIFKHLNAPVYWAAILLSAILFALGHFPVVFMAVNDPSFTLLSYILIGNISGGIIFGWLYWKKGLASAMTGHIAAHLMMLLLAPLL